MPDGVVAQIGSKIVQGGARFPWALGITGNVSAVALGTELLKVGIGSLKQLERRLAPAMKRAMSETQRRFPDTPEVSCGVRGAAWDFAQKKPIAFMMHSHPEQLLPGTDPFTWYTCSYSITCENPDGVGTLLGRHADLTDPADFAADVDGLALLEAQRITPMSPTAPGIDQSAKYRIGGEAQLVTVTKHGVKIEELKAWPDKIGQRINPHG